MKNRPLVSAALLGLGGGLRSFAPPVALALRGRGPLAGPARFIAFGAAAGEFIADKQPQMASRLALRGLALRLGFSSSGGRDLGGWEGAGVATVAALAAAFAGSRLRVRRRAASASLEVPLLRASAATGAGSSGIPDIVLAWAASSRSRCKPARLAGRRAAVAVRQACAMPAAATGSGAACPRPSAIRESLSRNSTEGAAYPYARVTDPDPLIAGCYRPRAARARTYVRMCSGRPPGSGGTA
jgi:hypothetical protein